MLQEIQNQSYGTGQTESKHLPNTRQAKRNALQRPTHPAREPRLPKKRQNELNNQLCQNVIRINVHIEALLAQEQDKESSQHLEEITQILRQTQRVLTKKAEYLSSDKFYESELHVNPLFKLTEREREILTLITYGYTSARIADRLHLASSTVRTYRCRILQKLGVKDTIGLQRFAIKHDLVNFTM